jgi:hypothetical protein
MNVCTYWQIGLLLIATGLIIVSGFFYLRALKQYKKAVDILEKIVK